MIIYIVDLLYGLIWFVWMNYEINKPAGWDQQWASWMRTSWLEIMGYHGISILVDIMVIINGW
jgi:hypothetical protein